jgi:S1-C subfamily serine protease
MRWIFLALVATIVTASEAYAMRAIPDDNLAYPVLVTLKSGPQGTGFFFNTSNASYLVTARHVLFKEKGDELIDNSAELVSYAKDPADQTKNAFALDLAILKKHGLVKRSADHDVAVVKVGAVTREENRSFVKTPDGVSVLQTAKTGILGVGESTVKRFADVLTANQVFIFGYPTSLGLKSIPQIDYAKPLLRSGIVAGTNQDLRTIILDCPAYGGNSGGPVLEVELEGLDRKYRIIGVVSQFVPAVETWTNFPHGYVNTNVYNSGYTIATPMDFVLDFIAQF